MDWDDIWEGCCVIVVGLIAVAVAIAAAIVGAMVAAAGGILWGGGVSIFNYARSIKENIIDDNR